MLPQKKVYLSVGGPNKLYNFTPTKSIFAKLSENGKNLKIITVGSKGNDQLKRVYGDKIIANIDRKRTIMKPAY